MCWNLGRRLKAEGIIGDGGGLDRDAENEEAGVQGPGDARQTSGAALGGTGSVRAGEGCGGGRGGGRGAEEAGPTSELLFRRMVRVDDVGRALLQGLQSWKERSPGDPLQDAAPGVTVKDRAVPWQGPVRTEAPVRPAGPSTAARRTATELMSFNDLNSDGGAALRQAMEGAGPQQREEFVEVPWHLYTPFAQEVLRAGGDFAVDEAGGVERKYKIMEGASVVNQSCGPSTTTPPITLPEFTMSALGQCCNQEEADGMKTLLHELIVPAVRNGAAATCDWGLVPLPSVAAALDKYARRNPGDGGKAAAKYVRWLAMATTNYPRQPRASRMFTMATAVHPRQPQAIPKVKLKGIRRKHHLFPPARGLASPDRRGKMCSVWGY